MNHDTQETVTRKHTITLTWKEFTEQLGIPEHADVSTYVPSCGWGAGADAEYNKLSRANVTIEWTEVEKK